MTGEKLMLFYKKKSREQKKYIYKYKKKKIRVKKKNREKKEETSVLKTLVGLLTILFLLPFIFNIHA